MKLWAIVDKQELGTPVIDGHSDKHRLENDWEPGLEKGVVELVEIHTYDPSKEKVYPIRECKCCMRTKLVGDGCEGCNPEKALEYAYETIEDLEKTQYDPSTQVVIDREVYSRAKENMLERYKNKGQFAEWIKQFLSAGEVKK